MASISNLPVPEEKSIIRTVEEMRMGTLAEHSLSRLSEISRRIPTGLSWDAALAGGLMIPSFTILGAKPKCGKSTIMSYIADSATLSGSYCYYLDFENGLNRLIRRLIARIGRLSIDEWAKREAHMREQNSDYRDAKFVVTDGHVGQRLFVETNRRLSPEDVERRISAIWGIAKSRGKDLLVVIDSIQKLWMENLSDRRSGIDNWLRFFEYLRDKYQIAILAASELKRPPVGQTYKANEISLKESGDIEYTADIVITLDRESAANGRFIDDPIETDPIKVTVVYNRDGPCGRLRKDLFLVYPYHDVQERDVEDNGG